MKHNLEDINRTLTKLEKDIEVRRILLDDVEYKYFHQELTEEDKWYLMRTFHTIKAELNSIEKSRERLIAMKNEALEIKDNQSDKELLTEVDKGIESLKSALSYLENIKVKLLSK